MRSIPFPYSHMTFDELKTAVEDSGNPLALALLDAAEEEIEGLYTQEDLDTAKEEAYDSGKEAAELADRDDKDATISELEDRISELELELDTVAHDAAYP